MSETPVKGHCEKHNMDWTGGCPLCHLEAFWGKDEKEAIEVTRKKYIITTLDGLERAKLSLRQVGRFPIA
jgi:hypothetical protein